ncbi:MAG: hypothetical protein HY826_10295, partial [Actinobacteria bacterium]|nr:hypothetical protein [Actinomycetota bacterium]
MSTMPPPPPPSSVPPGYQAYSPEQAMNSASWGASVGGYILNALAAELIGLPSMITFYAGPREYKECTIDGEAGLCKLTTS